MAEDNTQNNTNQNNTPTDNQTNNTNTQTNNTQNNQTNTSTNNDSNDFNKLLEEVEKDINKQKEDLFTEFKAKFDKELGIKDEKIEALNKQLSTIESKAKEETQKIIDAYKEEMKGKLSNLEKEVSSKKSVIPEGSNPFRDKGENNSQEFGKEWWKDKSISEEEKYLRFQKHVLGK